MIEAKNYDAVVKDPVCSTKIDKRTDKDQNLPKKISDFAPSHKKLDGIVTLIGMATSGVSKLTANKISKFVAKIFNFKKEHVFNEKTNAQINSYKDLLSSVITNLKPLSPSKTETKEVEEKYAPPSQIHQSGLQMPESNSLMMLNCCKEAYKEVGGNLNLSPAFCKALAKLLEEPTSETPKKIQTLFKKELTSTLNATGKDLLKAKFDSEVHKARGRHVPKTMEHSFGFGINASESKGGTQERSFKEETTSIDQSLSGKFLAAANSKLYEQQIKYSESLKGGAGIRPSASRLESEVQGTGINMHVHKLNNLPKADNGEVGSLTGATIYRSGAFAVHDKTKPGLAALKDIQKNINTLTTEKEIAQQYALCKFSADELKAAENNPQLALEIRIQKRTDLSVAQGLTKIAASIKETVTNPQAMENVKRTGSFLHVEQSLLTENGGDLTMIHDMKGAMDHITDKVKVKFTNDSEGEKFDFNPDGTITMTLYSSSSMSEGEFEEGFGITALLFTQGVNEEQSIAHAFGKDEGVQDKYNVDSSNKLNVWAGKAEQSDVMQPLEAHYDNENTRKSKDIKGIDVLHDTVVSLGGGFGIVCKSGKDRTGALTCHLMARAAAKSYEFDENSSEKALAKKLIQEELLGGISYRLTGFNKGTGDDAFAFNPMQLDTIPEEIRPPPELCGAGPA